MRAYSEKIAEDRKICFIVGAGKNYGIDIKLNKYDVIIAADGGFAYLKEVGICPDLIIGDFDSLEGKIPENALVLPKEKDITDMQAAIEIGIERGYKTFVIYGGTGGRADHTFANIQILSYIADIGGNGFLIDENCIFTVIKDDEIIFDKNYEGYISVFSLSDVSMGVNEHGLKYVLDNAELKRTYPLGVSNEFIGIESSVSVKKGTILVIYPRQEKNFVI